MARVWFPSQALQCLPVPLRVTVGSHVGRHGLVPRLHSGMWAHFPQERGMSLPLVGQGELGRKDAGGRTAWPRGGWDRGCGIEGLGVEEGQFKRDRVLGNSETDSWESRCVQQMKTLDFYPVDNGRTPKDLWTKGSCGHKCPISQVVRAVIHRWRKEPRRTIRSQSASCGKRTVIWLSRELGPSPSVTTNHTSDVQ